MNLWLIAALALVLAVLPCGFVLSRGAIMDRLVALQLATGICTLTLVLVAPGLNRPSFLDMGLTLALLGYPASLLFARFLELWL
jgi:multisubunit Na+/H+ antiporter MnhF subunit